MARFIGNGAGNRLEGGAENDVFRGRGGNDTLIGGAGNDIFYGDDGDDVIFTGTNNDIDTIFAGRGNDTYNFAGSLPSGGDFAFHFVDYRKFSGTIVADIGLRNGTVVKSGNAGTDTLRNLQTDAAIWGFGIADTVGDDVITMALARDVFVSFQDSGGNDRYVGGASFDRITYANNGLLGPVEVTIEGYDAGGMRGVARIGDGSVDTFANIDEIQGSRDTDRFVGNSQRDRFIPDAGDDFVDGQGGRDLVRYDRNNAIEVVVDLRQGTAQLTYENDFARDGTWFQTLRNIEDVRGTAGDDTLRGSGGDNTLEGRGGDDLIIGRTGNDLLRGEAGEDTLRAGAGNDTLNGGSGDDVLIGGAGSDVFQFSDSDGSTDQVRRFVDGVDRFEVFGGVEFGDLIFTSINGGRDTMIEIDGFDGEVIVRRVSTSELGEDDFIFS